MNGLHLKKRKNYYQLPIKPFMIGIKGKIRTIRDPSGNRRYNSEDIQNYLDCFIPVPIQKKRDKICYCRVSSKKQMDDLERQKRFFQLKYPSYELVTDIGSGLNWKKRPSNPFGTSNV